MLCRSISITLPLWPQLIPFKKGGGRQEEKKRKKKERKKKKKD